MEQETVRLLVGGASDKPPFDARDKGDEVNVCIRHMKES